MTVIQLKVTELSGIQLDACVAHVEGVNADLCRDDWGDEVLTVDGGVGDHGRLPRVPYSPSTNWADGGPIIQRERIALEFIGGAWDAVWNDTFTGHTAPGGVMSGPAPLIAAMRALLLAHVGDTVELPA